MVDDADDLKEATGRHRCSPSAAEDEPGEKENDGVPDHIHNEFVWL